MARSFMMNDVKVVEDNTLERLFQTFWLKDKMVGAAVIGHDRKPLRFDELHLHEVDFEKLRDSMLRDRLGGTPLKGPRHAAR